MAFTVGSFNTFHLYGRTGQEAPFFCAGKICIELMPSCFIKEIFASNNPEHKKLVIGRLGADLKLSGRTLEFAPVKCLIPLAKGQECLKAKKEAARTAS